MILLLLACKPTPTPPEPVRDNVLIVLADDLGLDAIEVYGVHDHPARTPTIDGLAERGVRFDNAWGTPACSAARAQLITGRFGRRYGLGNIVSLAEDAEPFDLPEQEHTLGELATEAGYTSIWIGKWHLTSYTRSWIDGPRRHGFERYRSTAGNLGSSSTGEESSYTRFERNHNGVLGFVDGYITTVQTDDALEEAAAAPGPWMMVVAYNAPHEPFTPPPPELYTGTVTDESPEAERYRAVVEALDTELDRLLEGLPSNTRVVFAADNGTPLRALLPPTPPLQGTPGWKEGSLNIPVLVSGPDIEPGVSGARVQLVDLLPTVAAWMDASTEADLDGFDLTPQLIDPRTPSPRTLQYTDTFPEHHQPDIPSRRRVTVRGERWKYLVVDEEESLYDLAETRWDTPSVNVIETADPDLLRDFREQVAEIHEATPYRPAE